MPHSWIGNNIECLQFFTDWLIESKQSQANLCITFTKFGRNKLLEIQRPKYPNSWRKKI